VTLPSEYDHALTTRKAAYKKYAQAMPGAYAITKKGISPCKAKCPAHISVQGYVALVAQGKFREALRLIKEENPLPAICGRVCHHPCESACTRSTIDQPVAINPLKRFVADLDLHAETRYQPAVKEKKQEKIAVIGSGPAGLSCAYYLAREGYQVSIYERLPVPGGMLSVGIPEYRLPKEVIDAEIQVIREMGVHIELGVDIGRSLTIEQLRRNGYRAIFLGIGAQECKKLGIAGEELGGIYPGLDLLRDANLGKPVDLGKRVAVIGGGNVAMDCVRTALRLGSEEAFVVYRRSLDEMPANEEEITECKEEGIQIHTLTNPKRILGKNGKVTAIECIRMKLGDPDESGRRRPVPIEGSEFIIELDAVIPAIGQESDWACLSPECACTLSPWGTVNVDPLTLQTDDPDIFAGGDAVTGPKTVIEAIEAGKQGAISIHRYIQGQDLREGREKEWEAARDIRTEGYDRIPRTQMPRLDPRIRASNFEEVQRGFTEGQAIAEARRCISCAICSECYQCVEACRPGAVTLETHLQKPETIVLEVGSIILAPGFQPFDPTRFETYNYATHPNVVTSMEFERILSATGPTLGHILRSSDQREPKKIAWLQCVGSRDINRCDHGYCSSVCCMYAIKEAVIAKEHLGGDLDCAIFFMDMRTHGKDFERYYNDARDKRGVRFIRSRIHSIDPVGDSGNLLLRYANERGEFKEELFDMVVLSVGMETSTGVLELAEKLGVDLSQGQFCSTKPFQPVNTSREGIHVCGAFQGPKDIPQSIMEASAAGCTASMDLSAARWSATKTRRIPEEIDVSSAEPRIGVFVCNCGTNIGGIVNVPDVVQYASTLPHVVHVEQNLFTCAQDTQDRMKSIISEHNLNRVIVAACSPRTHEPLFQETLQACGLNKFLFEMANIRNQDSWVHSSDPTSATDKARDLVRMAVARAALLRPLKAKKISINKRALIIGGGISGMTAALGLAEQGFEAVLVEKERNLGGLAKDLSHTIEGANIPDHLLELMDRVTHHEKIQVLTESLIVGFSGFKGNFTTEVMVGPGMYERKIDHGAVVVATGANEYQPQEYLYGKDQRVLTQIELGKRLDERGADDLKHVVMIQCVGSRNEDYPNCSRICCQSAVKNALHIKELNPAAEIYVLYRDLRTYGELEYYYREARRQGVHFFRFDRSDPPEASLIEGGLLVTFKDQVLQRNLRVSADMLVLSAGVRAADTEELASILRLARNQDGYFMEAHVKLRPVDMATDGVYVCGTAHAPKLISESIAQAMAAASRAATFLSQSEITLSAVTAAVDQDKCASCLICVRVCPYTIPRINKEGVSEIDEALCRGCGVCAAECPAKAIQLSWYEDDQVLSKVDALLEGVL
jgi:heterodisulfide reductase subunit A-like polyferredoxin